MSHKYDDTLRPSVGDWVTWGKQVFAYEVVYVDTDTLLYNITAVWMLCDNAPPNNAGHPELVAVKPDRVIVVRQAGTAPPEQDIVTRPKHYTKWAIEPITFIMRNGFEFWRGNIVKYASRAGSKLYDGMDETKSEIADLKKVIRYAEMRINQLNGEQIL